jgi:hypothetical protein
LPSGQRERERSLLKKEEVVAVFIFFFVVVVVFGICKWNNNKTRRNTPVGRPSKTKRKLCCCFRWSIKKKEMLITHFLLHLLH